MKAVVVVVALLATGCATSGQLQQANDKIETLSQRLHMAQRGQNELTRRVRLLEVQQAHTAVVIQGLIEYLKAEDEE